MYDEKWLTGKIKEKLRGKMDKALGRRIPYTEAQVMDGFKGGNSSRLLSLPRKL